MRDIHFFVIPMNCGRFSPSTAWKSELRTIRRRKKERHSIHCAVPFYFLFYRCFTVFVTIQPAELSHHPAIENRFAMGRTPAGAAFSYGLCGKCTDRAKQLPVFLRSYLFTSSEVPVISFGCSIPISSSSVGTISASLPPSLSV